MSDLVIGLERLYENVIIAATEDDDEKAHHAEKVLWMAALQYISTEPPGCDAAWAAKMALKSLEIDFSRWFA